MLRVVHAMAMEDTCISPPPSEFFSGTTLPKQFVWRHDQKPNCHAPPIQPPEIDLADLLSGDPSATSAIASVVHSACQTHGFFLVTNHGIDPSLISAAHTYTDDFFKLPLSEKNKLRRKPGDHCGYASSFINRFTSNLPWKETLSFQFSPLSHTSVENYFNHQSFISTGMGAVFQRYCEAINELSLRIMELIGISLGVGRKFFREFYEENESIMRLNYYPPCHAPEETLGTGPHCDPTSLTILHQDAIDGLQVFADQQWRLVSPNANSFVVNIGDTLMAHCNGRFNSCLHRAVVNKDQPRKSLAFFLCPKSDMVVAPPPGLVGAGNPRRYPDFTWATFLEFTQKCYRADMNTLHAFSSWLADKRNP